MTLLLSMSPACNVIVGKVEFMLLVTLNNPWVLRQPSALATTVYVPAGSVTANELLRLDDTEAINTLPASETSMVSGWEAITCPLIIPVGKDVGEMVGVDVGATAVGEATGVSVITGVADGKVPVGVAVGVTASHIYVPMI